MKGEAFACILCVALILTSVMPAKSSPTAEGDLYITEAHLLQVTRDPAALIAEKPTAFRVSVQSTFSRSVHADIKVTYNFGTGSYVERGPNSDLQLAPGTTTLYIPGGPVYAYDGLDAWSFDPPGLLWTSTGSDNQIVVEVDSDHEVTETADNNNRFYLAAVEAFTSKQLKILVVPIGQEQEPGCPDVVCGWHCEWGAPSHCHFGAPWPEGVNLNMEYLRDTYPVATNLFSWTMGDAIIDPTWWTSEELYQSHVRDLSAQARILGYDRVVAVIPGPCRGEGGMGGGIAIGMLREPEDRVPVIVSFVINSDPYLKSRPFLVAHEIGHTYYLWHPFDIGPPVYYGERYWVAGRQYAQLANTFMDYGPFPLPVGIDEGRYDSDPKTWIDLPPEWGDDIDGTWQWNLFDQFRAVYFPPMSVLALGGYILLDGTFELDRNWYRIPLGIPDLLPSTGPQNGNYTILMLNSNQQVLSQMSFNASFTRLINGPIADGTNPPFVPERLEKIPFLFNVPYIEGTALVQIQDNMGHVVAERVVTANSPTVHVTSPNGGESLTIGSRYTITWEASDTDGDQLGYLLAYSRDGGENWIPVASNLQETQYVWDTSNLTPGDRYLVKVIATDSVNTGEDASDGVFTFLGLGRPIPVGGVVEPPRLTLRNLYNRFANKIEHDVSIVLSGFPVPNVSPLLVVVTVALLASVAVASAMYATRRRPKT